LTSIIFLFVTYPSSSISVIELSVTDFKLESSVAQSEAVLPLGSVALTSDCRLFQITSDFYIAV